MDNYCINCVHFSDAHTNDPTHEFARCTRRGKPDPVTGQPRYPYCSTERSYASGTCAEGIHFQPKESNHAEQ
jgi:hypothetical protein